MRSTLITNGFFKTTEYKLVSSTKIEITEISNDRVETKSYMMKDLELTEVKFKHNFLSNAVLFFACALIFSTIFFSQSNSLIQSNLLNLIFFFCCVFGALWFLCRPTDCHICLDKVSKKSLFQIQKKSADIFSINLFIEELTTAIETAKNTESSLINLKSKARLEYEQHNKNVDDLMNSGMIDEALYKRICSTMHENVFGRINHQYNDDKVIFLNK